MSIVLSPAELADLTGRKQARPQIIWLARQGWTFSVGADGKPKVDREYATQKCAEPASAVPHDFLGIDDLRRKARSVRKQCGIYFLFDLGELVYVGQTKDYARRVRSHSDRKQITFDAVAFVRVPWEYLDLVEAEYIARFKPKHNKR